MNKPRIAICWHRRDLRLHDNAALYHALKGPDPVLSLFIFDRDILEQLEDRDDARVQFIHEQIAALKQPLQDMGSDLLVWHGRPQAVWTALLEQFDVRAVYLNRDYEPSAMARDESIRQLLALKGIVLHTSKDHVLLESHEVLKADKTPYTVFTPYSRRWLEKIESRPDPAAYSFYLKPYPNEKYFSAFLKTSNLPKEWFQLPTLESLGFTPSKVAFPPAGVPPERLRFYDKTRDFPGKPGTSRLGIHLRFGTISIRQLAQEARAQNAVFLNELIWRDFYSQILAHFPHVAGNAFKPAYERVAWRYDAADFERWCKGLTGYPIVDAGMRELSATGFMHNRVRMITASFLTKHLLLDWRMGEAWFARKLLDFDLASNSGGWQWAAGCGTDAAPYFRIFNPTEQAKKFDPEYTYIRRWVPEFGTPKYPRPMVDHAYARARCLEAFKAALG